MTQLPPNIAAPTDETSRAAEIVERFLVASMVPDPETAALYIASDLRITLTGGRRYGIHASRQPSMRSATNG